MNSSTLAKIIRTDRLSMTRFPENKRFAFTVLDDTDLSTIENIGSVYRLLTELGMRTTKTVWPLASVREGRYGGCSLQDPEYLKFILSLKESGFEIALHNVRNHDSTREIIEQGLEEFRRCIGHNPRVHSNHCNNRENIYWGAARFHMLGPLYRAGSTLLGGHSFEGHDPSTRFFWGDLCKEQIDYVRNFAFREINLDRVNPTMPYHDPSRPFVKYWFSSCEGGNAASFCETICEANQDRIEAEGGVCIMYTHFACGFEEGGSVDFRTEQLLRRLADLNGWFVPVSTLLDFLCHERQATTVPATELVSMERRWALDKMALLGRRAFDTRLAGDHNFRKQAMSTVSDRKSYRIVHLTSAHPALDVRIFHKECRSLSSAGYEVVVLGNHASNDIVGGVRLRGLGQSSSRLQRMTIKLCGICREAFRAGGDLYHIHEPELLIVGLFLRAAGKRVIYDIHEDLPRTVPYKAYVSKSIRKPLMWIVERAENAAARRMSGLVAATPAIKSRFRLVHSHTVVVNNYPIAEELTSSTTLEWKRRDPAVTYLGGISEERGIREILAAMDLLPRNLAAKLELAGWFPVQRLQAELAAGPQWQHVQWRGQLDRRGIASLLNRVRAGLVILHPEKNFVVSHPVKLFEYMAAGIPVIASDFPLWRRIIQGAGCGLLVDPFDTRAIASAIERLITSPCEAEAMGRRGRKAVEERFNWANEERTLLSFYSSLLPRTGVLENSEKQVLSGNPETI